MNMQQAIQTVMNGQSLDRESMRSVMEIIMTGQATGAQIGGFLIGLRMKGETVDEVTAAAEVMRSLAAKVDVTSAHLVDTCGTGGDASGTFNISTACAFVAAAAGAQVAKHGNRSVSSKSGSADVLETAGVNLNLTPEQVAACINEIGVGFLFAPKHHGAMKHAIGPRKEMGVRTLFNVLGPLTNPASAPNQVLGVYDAAWVEPLANVLKALGSQHVMVVHAEDGLDELSIASASVVAELKDGEITTYRLSPADVGLTQRASLDEVKVTTSAESLAMIQLALSGEASAARDIVALNAGAAVYVSGKADSLQAGVDKALEVMSNGSAAQKLADLAAYTQPFAEK